jgi:hypothetical protein
VNYLNLNQKNNYICIMKNLLLLLTITTIFSCSKKEEMLETLNTDIINFNKLLGYFNLDIRDVQIYSKKKSFCKRVDLNTG